MKINQKYVSFYYQGMTEVPDMQLERSKTALLIIDMQKEFVNRDCGDYLNLFRIRRNTIISRISFVQGLIQVF